jgi:hypothetical protein
MAQCGEYNRLVRKKQYARTPEKKDYWQAQIREHVEGCETCQRSKTEWQENVKRMRSKLMREAKAPS